MVTATSIRLATSRPRPLHRACTIDAHIDTDPDSLFAFVVAEDVLPKVLKRYGLVPAVVGTSGNTGPWDQRGSTRTVHLAGNTQAREQVSQFDRPHYFSYRVDRFTFAVRHLADFATGEWWFRDEGDGAHVRWTYTFHSKGPVTAALLAMFIRLQWKGYMRGCIVQTGRLAAGSPAG